jgi:endonuclease/exonuclease/phosphatase family metal-dependent hydrolase
MPLLGFFFADGEEGESVPAEPLRVMTYNIHSSYDTDGRFDIGAIASVIEASRATVVGIQEIPRGRLISGVTDQVLLLQQRLGFEHVAFFGTTDPSWGNAVLSRFPILDVEKTYLPLEGTPMRRGYLGVTLQTSAGPVLFISTHLQHINDPDFHEEDPEADLYPVHQAQIATIVEAWGGAQPAVLVGDFNARPGWAQIEDIVDAGWVDAWSETGVGDGFTARSNDPRYRIDYVFHTPDLEATDAGVLITQASDHLPLVVDLGLADG